MVNLPASTYPNVTLSSPPSETSGQRTTPAVTVIQSPHIQEATARLTSKSKLLPEQNYVEKYPNYTNSALLFSDNNIKVIHKSSWTIEKEDGYSNINNVLQIETGDKADTIKVSQPSANEINLQVNGAHYTLKLNNHENYPEELHIKSKGGNDKIKVDPSVTVPITIEGGRGNDQIEALGSGLTAVYGGAGNDDITLGSGAGYAEGNSGDDKMKGGTGKSVMYGNAGRDQMFSGAGSKGTFSYMDGGAGDDFMISESPFNVMHGGPGQDFMYGRGPTTFYTGRGRDTVFANDARDKVYADAGDRVCRVPGSTLRPVTISDAGNKGLNIEGTDKFRQRTEDDLEFFRNSPTAQKMLTELDQAAERNGAPVTIKETLTRSNYSFANAFTRETDKQLKDYDDISESTQLGFIHDNTKGSVATSATIHSNPRIIFTPTPIPPIVDLYHEMAHAYNGANGTSLPGTTTRPDLEFPEPNSERQAVGVETDAPAFDFDNDRATPPTTTNPKTFTENALREEMGFPLRKSYSHVD